MIWITFKTLITTICLLFATLILIATPFNFATFGLACFLAFLGIALWVDYTKPLNTQNLSPAYRHLVKVTVWGLIISFTIIFLYGIFNDESHFNGRGFIQLIVALLKAL